MLHHPCESQALISRSREVETDVLHLTLKADRHAYQWDGSGRRNWICRGGLGNRHIAGCQESQHERSKRGYPATPVKDTIDFSVHPHLSPIRGANRRKMRMNTK